MLGFYLGYQNEEKSIFRFITLKNCLSLCIFKETTAFMNEKFELDMTIFFLGIFFANNDIYLGNFNYINVSHMHIGHHDNSYHSHWCFLPLPGRGQHYLTIYVPTLQVNVACLSFLSPGLCYKIQ